MSRDCIPAKQTPRSESRTRLRNVSPGTQEVSLASANRPAASRERLRTHSYITRSIMVSVATTKDRIRRTTRYLIGHVREISPTGLKRKLMSALKGELWLKNQRYLWLSGKNVCTCIAREKLSESILKTIIDSTDKAYLILTLPILTKYDDWWW